MFYQGKILKLISDVKCIAEIIVCPHHVKVCDIAKFAELCVN